MARDFRNQSRLFLGHRHCTAVFLFVSPLYLQTHSINEQRVLKRQRCGLQVVTGRRLSAAAISLPAALCHSLRSGCASMKSRASPSALEVSPLVVLTTRVSGDFQLTALNLWIARRERSRLEKLLTGISSVVSVSPLPHKGCEQVTTSDQISSEENTESNQKPLLAEEGS